MIKTLSTKNNLWKVMKSDLGPFGNLERTSGNQQDKIVLLFIIGNKRDNPICFWFNANVSNMAQRFKVLYTHKYISQAYIQPDKCKWAQTNTRRPSIYYPQRLSLNSRPISTLVEFSSKSGDWKNKLSNIVRKLVRWQVTEE